MPEPFTTHFHKLVADGPQALLDMTDFKSTFVGEGSNDLADEANKTTEKLQGQVTAFSRAITNEANHKPSNPSKLPEWKKKLMDKNEENKAALAKMCDISMNSAMDKIRAMPEGLRDEAADKWNAAWDFIMKAVKKVIEFLDKAWQTVINLWNALVDAVIQGIEQVKQWAAEAMSAILDQASKIKDLFGF